MSEDNLGNNAPAAPQSTADSSAAIAQLQAQMKAGEALVQPITEESASQPQATATEEAPPVTTPTPEKGNKDSLQQFRDKEGNVDLSKIEKANEHLTAAITTKEERIAKLLETNKELMRKHTKVSQEVKKVSPEDGDTPYDVNPKHITKEFRERLHKDLEEDAPGTIAKLVHSVTRQVIDQELTPLKSEWQQSKEEKRTNALVRDMDSMVEKGHGWLLTPEGAKRLDDTFAARPYLLQSPTPYSDAVALMGISPDGPQGGIAPAARQTPILGGSNGVPPPSTPRTASPDAELETLAKDSGRALAEGNVRKAQEIQKRMNEIYRRANPDSM